MNKKLLIPILCAILVTVAMAYTSRNSKNHKQNTDVISAGENDSGPALDTPHELTIQALRKKTAELKGSEIVIEETLTPGSNYHRYIASYVSEGNKIYALLTVPNGEKPATGWPVVIFNHGFIPPAEYRTTERYIAYTDGFSRNGYIVFRSDYRGHGKSEGIPSGAYGNDGYTVDVINAVESVKKYADADPNRIGMWGHSMGGYITLRSMVVLPDIKAGVIWAGVVGSYADLVENWRRNTGSPTPAASPSGARRWRQSLTEKYGSPQNNPQFWNSISANTFLTDISGPIQLHHGTADHSVPVQFSETLKTQMDNVRKKSELYIYPGDDHNLTNSFSTAMNRSVEFFDTYVKNGGKQD